MTNYLGDGWFQCHLFNPKYKLGFKFTNEFKEKYEGIAVSVDSCHQADVEQEDKFVACR